MNNDAQYGLPSQQKYQRKWIRLFVKLKYWGWPREKKMLEIG
jgi:hypothetical protein